MMTSHQIACVHPSLIASLEPLAHHRNVASLSLFYSYYFGRCSSELVELVPFPHSCGSSTRYSIRLHDFSVTFPRRCYKDFYINSFFPRTARFWNSWPAEFFPLTYDINGFKSRFNRHLFSLGSFYTVFLYGFHLFLLFLVTPSLAVVVQPCME